MKKIFIILAVILFLSGVVYFVFFHSFSENQYNNLMCYYISRQVTKNSKDFESKVSVLRDFVNENVHPVTGYDTTDDGSSIMTLLSGVGWCDSQARAFMQLASRVGIAARLLFLNMESRSSPHSVAEALAPDNRWIIVDPYFKLELINKEGKFASQGDIKSDPGIIINNPRIKLSAAYDPKWSDPKFIAIYYNPPEYVVYKRGKTLFLLDSIPIEYFRPIFRIMQDRALIRLNQNRKSVYECDFIEARGLQFLNYYNEAERIYDKIIKNSDDSSLVQRTEFYKAVLLKDKGMLHEADKYIDKLLNNGNGSQYRPYLSGLKARILEKLGRSEEADDVLRGAEYSLQI